MKHLYPLVYWFRLGFCSLSIFVGTYSLFGSIFVFAEEIFPEVQVEQPPAEEAEVVNQFENQVETSTEQPPLEEPVAEPEALVRDVSDPTFIPRLEVNEKTKVNSGESVDSVNGAFNYEYRLTVPPGRNGMEPNLSLGYSSNNLEQSIFGLGWDINIPSIERINKKGTNKLYTTDYFTSSLSGELVQTGQDTYRAKVETGDFLSYKRLSSGWLVTDKDGNQYKFGQSTGAQQNNPSNSNQVFKWMLEEVRDTNNNYISYTYYKDDGQIYPAEIKYTNSGLSTGIFKIVFVRELRNIQPISYDTGFRVKTNYRINEIRTEVNGSWARKYNLSYETGDNGSEQLLDKIVESGKSLQGVITTLPAIDFDYQKSVKNWDYNESFQVPSIFSYENDATEIGMRTADINGDGLVDILCHNDETNGNCSKYNPEIKLNNGDGSWTGDGWSFPNKVDNPERTETFADANGNSTGLLILDINGDGLNDLARKYSGNNGFVYINNGTEWVYDPNWVLPTIFEHISRNNDHGTRLSDLNGDGLIDIVCHNSDNEGPCGQANPTVYTNTGSGFVETLWEFPNVKGVQENTEVFSDRNGRSSGLTLIDVNKDNLPDLVRSPGNENGYVYLNTGTGWVYEPSMTFTTDSFFTMNDRDIGQRISDINNDGLVDVICRNNDNNGICGKNNPAVHINNGMGDWSPDSSWGMPYKVDDSENTEHFASEDGISTKLTTLDVNGDGQDDLIRYASNRGYVYLNQTKSKVDLLTKITYPEGGSTNIEYKSTALLRNQDDRLSNPKLSNPMNVVTKIETNDGNNTIQTTKYEYTGGKNYFKNSDERKFAGFETIKKIDDRGNYTKTYFHQGDGSQSALGEHNDRESKIGRVFRVETYDKNNSLQNVNITKWEETALSSNSHFVYAVSSISKIFDGSISKDKAETYVYNTTSGNLEQKKEWGDVLAQNDGTFSDTGSDSFLTLFNYATNPASSIFKVSKITVTNQNNAKERETLYYFDNLPFGQLSLGNNTKEDVWISKGSYATTEKTYNSFGLIQSIKDPRGKITNFGFDAYNLYQTTITNPLLFTKYVNYNYILGKPASIRDENNNTVLYLYDGLGRLKEYRTPTETSAIPAVHTAFLYSDVPNNFSVKTTKYLSPSVTTSSYVYFDGLGRKIQEKNQVADGYQTSDIIYNNDGNILKTSLPYISSEFTKTPATTNSKLYVEFEYDFANRVIKTTDVFGVTSHSYNLYDETVTDALNKKKKFSRNSFGQLVAVTEYLGNTGLQTLYTYNYAGNLTQITDSLRNVRNFWYDGRGLLSRAEDLHSSSDTTFGTHTFSYDLSGNMLNHTSPTAGMTYTYNDANQLLTEDNYVSSGVDVTFEYNNCQNGKMKLCKVTNQSGLVTSYNYTKDGNIKSESKTLDGNTFTESFVFDKQGNTLSITYPDNSIVNYTYDEGGGIKTINRQINSTSPIVPVINNITYNPVGSIANISYANGLTQTNAYDADRGYELRNKKTGTIQDVTYTYDNAGNIVNLNDTSITSTKKSATYIYDDLYRVTNVNVTNVATKFNPYTENFTYNHIGNLLSKNGVSYVYTGNGFANPHAPTSIGSATLAYDNSGNLLSDGTRTNSWTYKNQLATVRVGLNTFSYTYDHTGERIKESGASSIVYTPFNNYLQSSTKKTRNVFLGSLLVATIDDSPTSSTTVSYIISDHLGSTEKVTNQAGILAEVMDYYAYGNERLRSEGPTKRRYIGEIYDSATGYNYLNARYYDSNRGQFISQDPMFWQLPEQLLLDPQQMNSYSYARNNPINRSDPSGQLSWSAVKNFFKKFGNNEKESAEVSNKEGLNFKLPLPGGKEWKVSTAIGENLPSHSGINHYSIDLAPESRSLDGKIKLENNVRIYAMADGIINDLGYIPKNGQGDSNGHYVVINHANDVQTRYLHLASDPNILGPVGPGIKGGINVRQGQFIGIMGNTGTTDVHLHVGLRYKNHGYSTNESGAFLNSIKVDGKYMKDFIVGQYYLSTNTH